MIHMTKEFIRDMLPRVGERRMETPTSGGGAFTYTTETEPCVVVTVHRDNLWYRVRFDRTGLCETYKLPEGSYRFRKPPTRRPRS